MIITITAAEIREKVKQRSRYQERKSKEVMERLSETIKRARRRAR